MRENPDNWQRIESIIKWANMSTNYFARYIGLPRGENLYQIKRGNNGISRDVANRIVEKFPQISKLWVLTGEGQMFVSSELRGAQIPFYNIGVEQGVLLLDRLVPAWNLVIPGVASCDFAMRYDSREMGASLPAGTVVLLAKTEKERVIPGAEYVIVTRKIVTLRLAYPEAGNKTWRLVAGDELNFGDIVLKDSEVEAVYKVVGKLIINQ